jgi:voltage-gated potassium channel
MQHVIWNRLGFQNLLFWLFAYLVVNPFFTSLPNHGYVIDLLLSLVLFFAIFAVSRERKILSISTSLLILTLLLFWLDIFEVIELSPVVSYSILIIYLATLVYSFFIAIITSRKVTLRLISATLCLYLIIGMLWGAIYTLLETVVPGSFIGGTLEQATAQSHLLQNFTYFSFITLTTLGYGDITPQTMGAGGLCQAEAIVGQFYTTVLVAYLVGMYSSERNAKKEKVKSILD